MQIQSRPRILMWDASDWDLARYRCEQEEDILEVEELRIAIKFSITE